MSGQIFISYRRQDSSAWAGRLSDHLSLHFPSNQIFMDVDSVDLGEDFVNKIVETVGSCDVLIAVIGKGWLTSPDQQGQRRLDNAEDFVRIEIATALKRGIRVIPVLVDGASMPRSVDLPDDLKALIRRNALQLSHEGFRADSERLESAVGRALEKNAADPGESEEKRRQETEQREKERPPSPDVSTPLAKPETDKPFGETPKILGAVTPKTAESKLEKPPPPPAGGTGGKRPSKQVIAFSAVAAVLLIGGLIYLAGRLIPSPAQPAVASASPSRVAIATPAPVPTSSSAARQGIVDMTPLYKGEMNLWISSEPKNFSPQVAQEFLRDFPEFNLRDKNLSPISFDGAVLENPKDDSYPDVAFIDNNRQLQPLLTAKAVWQDWGGAARFDTRGWWVIFKDGKHIDQARAFLRWLSRSPHWRPMRVKNAALSGEQIQAIQRVSFEALYRILAVDSAGLGRLLDNDAAKSRLAPAHENFELLSAQPLLTFGNGQTAFVIIAALGSGDDLYGVRYQTFLLRNDGGDWRVLYFASEGLRQAEELFHTFDEKITSNQKLPTPPTADLISPPDKASLPRFPSRPTLEWKVASSTGLSFIVESQYGQPGNQETWSLSLLQFVEFPEDQHTFATAAPFGVGRQPHRWRIWTVNPSGGISISNWREIDFTN